MPDIEAMDEQDHAEVYDEDNYAPEDGGAVTAEFRTLEELPDVLDVTRADGDADLEEFDEDDIDIDDQLALDGIEAEADALLGVDGVRVNEIDTESQGMQGENEVELVYSGLMEDVRGAQSSAALWEAKRLSDDDIADLGYGPEAN